MSRRRRSTGVAALVAVAVLAAAGGPTAAGAAGTPGEADRAAYDIRDLVFDIRDLAPGGDDLVFSTQELDGSVTDSQREKQVELTLAADVFFAFDRDGLTIPAAAALAALAPRIGDEARGTVRIDGYTDAVGDAEYNRDLSRRRAATVQADLERRITGKHLAFVATGHGASDFVAANTHQDGSDNPQGRARNRRVTITYDR
jgi:OOP family OmpA-OmpF porin